MGNESSTPEHNNSQEGRYIQDERYLSSYNFERNAVPVPSSSFENSDDDDDYGVVYDEHGRPLNTQGHRRQRTSSTNSDPQQQQQRPTRLTSITGGSLQSNLTVAHDNHDTDHNPKFVDPILGAAAVGAAARKSRIEKSRKFQYYQQQQLQREKEQRRKALNQEWRSSFQRLASVATSTASTVANVTKPILSDASHTLVGSAKEFVKDVKEELKKQDEEDAKRLQQQQSNDEHDVDDDDEQSIYLYKDISVRDMLWMHSRNPSLANFSPMMQHQTSPSLSSSGTYHNHHERIPSFNSSLPQLSLPILKGGTTGSAADSTDALPISQLSPLHEQKWLRPQQQELKDDGGGDDDQKISLGNVPFDTRTMQQKDEHISCIDDESVVVDYQPLVDTPYGKGLVVHIRTSSVDSDNEDNKEVFTMREIQLIDWKSNNKIYENTLPGQQQADNSNNTFRSSSAMLYSPNLYPSVLPTIGDIVETQYGRGTVINIRINSDDEGIIYVVQLSTWKLGTNQMNATCYIAQPGKNSDGNNILQVVKKVAVPRNGMLSATGGSGSIHHQENLDGDYDDTIVQARIPVSDIRLDEDRASIEDGVDYDKNNVDDIEVKKAGCAGDTTVEATSPDSNAEDTSANKEEVSMDQNDSTSVKRLLDDPVKEEILVEGNDSIEEASNGKSDDTSNVEKEEDEIVDTKILSGGNKKSEEQASKGDDSRSTNAETTVDEIQHPKTPSEDKTVQAEASTDDDEDHDNYGTNVETTSDDLVEQSGRSEKGEKEYDESDLAKSKDSKEHHDLADKGESKSRASRKWSDLLEKKEQISKKKTASLDKDAAEKEIIAATSAKGTDTESGKGAAGESKASDKASLALPVPAPVSEASRSDVSAHATILENDEMEDGSIMGTSDQNSTEDHSTRPGLQRSDHTSITSLSNAIEGNEIVDEKSTRPNFQRSDPQTITSLSEAIEGREGTQTPDSEPATDKPGSPINILDNVSENNDLRQEISTGEEIKQMTLRSGRVLRGAPSTGSTKDLDEENEKPESTTAEEPGKDTETAPDLSPESEPTVEKGEDANPSIRSTKDLDGENEKPESTTAEASGKDTETAPDLSPETEPTVEKGEDANAPKKSEPSGADPSPQTHEALSESARIEESAGKAVDERPDNQVKEGHPLEVGKCDQNEAARNQRTRFPDDKHQKNFKGGKWKSFMFDENELSIFESYNKENGRTESSKVYEEDNPRLSQSGHNDGFPDKIVIPLRNPKKIVDYLLMRLSVDDQGRKETSGDPYMDARYRRSRNVKRSVFAAEEAKLEIQRSLSPPGSPPEVPSVVDVSEETSETLTQEGSMEEENEVFFWDLVPERGVVDAEPDMPDIPEEQRSTRSLSFLFETSQRTTRNQPSSAEPSAGLIESSSKRIQKSRSRRSGLDFRPIVKSMSGADLREQLESVSGPASLTLHWDSSESANLLTDEEMTEGFDKDGVLNEALLAFSSLEDVGFLKKIPQFPINATPPPDLAPLVWRQLLSRWKHAEIWKAMISRPSSLHFRSLKSDLVMSNDSDTVSSSSTIQVRCNGRRITFSSALSSVDAFSVFRNLSGFQPHSDDGEFMVLSGMVCELGPKSVFLPEAQDKNIQKEAKEAQPSSEVPTEKEGSNDVSELLKHAEAHLEGFSNIVKSIVEFASLNDISSPESDILDVTYTIGVKNYSSVRRKAARRYNGDIHLVKDILRGQITFPDDGSLICGLYHLWEIAQGSHNRKIGDDKSQVPIFEIVRFKNLFRTSDFGNTYFPALPSGYRHIIVNIKIENRVVAEIQFQLSQLFNVLGSEGYTLHREIIAYGEKNPEKKSDEKLTRFVDSVIRGLKTEGKPSTQDSRLATSKAESTAGSSSKKQEKPKPAPAPGRAGGGRGDLMASIAAGRGGKAGRGKADGGRGDLMSAIAGRGRGKGSAGGGRGDLMASIAAGRGGKTGRGKADGGRGDLMSVIEGRGKGSAGGGRGDLMASIAAGRGGKAGRGKADGGRGDLMSAIAGRGRGKGSAGGGRGDLTASIAAGRGGKTGRGKADGGRGDLMSVIAGRGKGSAGGGRGDLMASIAAGRGGKTGRGKADGGRGDLMSAIAGQGEEKGSANGGRGDLLASISGRGRGRGSVGGRGERMSPSAGRGGRTSDGGRGDLMSAIAGRGRGRGVSGGGPDGGRGDLLASIAGRGRGSDGGRGDLMSAIAGRGKGRGTVRGVADGGRGDLLASIAGRGRGRESDGGRGDLMSAITSRGGRTETGPGDADDGRANLMASIAGRGRGNSDGGRGDLMASIAGRGGKTGRRKADGKADGGRGDLMSAIAGRGSARGGLGGSDDGRGDMLASIAGRGRGPAGGGRGDLMSAIAGRGSGRGVVDGGRGDLMASIAAGHGGKTGRGSGKADGDRGDLMSAIAGRGKGKGSADGGRGDLMASIAAGRGGKTGRGSGKADGGRGDLMSAIAGRGRGKGSAAGGRGDLLASIAGRGGAKNDSVSSIGTSGVAQAAALAASKEKVNRPEATKNPEIAAGGIAAAAAAAARKDSSNAAEDTKDATENTTSKEKPESPNSVLLKEDSVSMLTSVLRIGSDEAMSNPRDLPSFYCLFLLVKRLSELVKEKSSEQPKDATDSRLSENDNLKLLAQRLLLRSLAISNQATSIGMVGWLEYGSSNQLERTLSLPFEVLQRLACSFASVGDWAKASDVLSSLVLRCEQHLPSYHPTTLSSMLDLAAAVSIARGKDLAKGIIQKASDLSAAYLSEHEAMFFDRCRFEASFESDSENVFEFDDNVDAITMIKAYSTGLREELSREFLCLIGQNHEIALLNHTFVGDALSVLANCLSAGAPPFLSNGKKPHEDPPTYYRYWSMAYIHYSIALKGWIKAQSLLNPNASASAYSVARCLRGLGRYKEATSILSTLASCLQESNSCQESDQTVAREVGDRRVMFLHPDLEQRSVAMQTAVKEQCLVMCVWQLAILTVEQSPDECGRVKALSLLHSASKALRNVLDNGDEMDNNTRKVCLELYECVEQEACNLFAPVREIHLPQESKTPVREEKNQFRIPALSPMRKKRFQSSQNHQVKQSGGKKPLVVHFV